MKKLPILETKLVPRRSPEEREKNHIIAINKQIQEYIKNGSVGTLMLEETPIKSLPDNLKRIGDGGSLILRRSSIERLPDNLKIDSALYITQCLHIKELPNNLIIGSELFAEDSGLESLPNDIKIGGGIYLAYTKVKKLPDHMKTINGDLSISHSHIKELPGDLIIEGNLHMKGMPDLIVPDSLIVHRIFR